MDVREFSPERVVEYEDWLRRNPAGFVLVERPKGRAIYHEADCQHIQPYPDDKGKGTAKVCARKLRDLREWARAREIPLRACRSCR